MVREARAAYRRRDEEMAQRKCEAGRSGSIQDFKGRERSWWDGATQDDAADRTPDTEVLNPIETSLVRPERVHFAVPGENNGPSPEATLRDGQNPGLSSI